MKNFLGLGIGIDLQWGMNLSSLREFARHSGGHFQYSFVSLQANSHDLLWNKESQNNVIKHLDDFFSCFPHLYNKLALHHTMLNMAGNMKDYPRELIINFTNLLIKHFGFRWVNEDLGIWYLNGKKTAYPFPPFLNQQSRELCVENIKWYQDYLRAPLLVEFPGYSEGSSFAIGEMNQIDFFVEVVNKSNCFWTLDTGHLLGSLYSEGKNLESLNLKDLPLSLCREIHLSGSAIVNGEFLDLHHGIIMPEQMQLLRLLRGKCENLWGVCYEDPKFTFDGQLLPKALPQFNELLKEINIWKQLYTTYSTIVV